MSLKLSQSGNIECSARSGSSGRGFVDACVCIGDYNIDIVDFLELVMYVFTNTDLEDDDVRLKYLERIKSLGKESGYNLGNERLVEKPASSSAIPSNKEALTFDEISEVLLSRSELLDKKFLYWMGMQLTSIFEEYESHNWNRCLFGNGGLCPGIVVCAHPVQACTEREEKQKKEGKGCTK